LGFLLAVALLAICTHLTAQNGRDDLSAKAAQTIEAASIRRSTSKDIRDKYFAYQPGRFLVRNQNMRIVIAMVHWQPSAAAGLSDSMLERVVGGPSWLDTDNYDIEGKADSSASDAALRDMARTLLEDRFRLRIRIEKREMPIYALVQTGGGARMKPSGDDCSETSAGTATVPPCGLGRQPLTQAGPSWSGRRATFAQLAQVVEGFVDRPVVDRTGLAGGYSFSFMIPAERIVEIMVPNPSEPGGSMSKVSGLLQEQLGLRLESTKGPADVLVIDSVERPSEN
jgi:uncharacterized protein (TIGR03435 family)